jgi:hypothetical protein
MGNKNLQNFDYTLDNTLWKWDFFSNHKGEKCALSGIFHGENGIFGGFLGEIFIIYNLYNDCTGNCVFTGNSWNFHGNYRIYGLVVT